MRELVVRTQRSKNWVGERGLEMKERRTSHCIAIATVEEACRS